MSNDNTLTFDGTRIKPSTGFELIVEPLTKELYDYQLAAIENVFLHKRVILGLQPGMGKTAVMQALIADRASIGHKSIVIVPPSLRLMWLSEFTKDYPHLKVATAVGMKAADLDPTADVVIINDSLLAARMECLLAWGPDAMFVDEAHRMKNADAKRTKAIIEMADLLPDYAMTVMATGTLATNNAGDVYCPLRVTGKENAKKISGTDKWTDFLDQWCETVIAWKRRVVVGCKDVEGLRNELIETCMVNIPRDEVLDLPDRTFNHMSLVLGAAEAAKYAVVQKHFLDWVKANFGDLAFERASKAEALTKIMRLWEIDGQVKTKASVEYIDSLVDQGEQVVVMAWHKTVIEGLREQLASKGRSVGAVIGGMSAQDKDDEVRWFQEGKTDVLVGQITAAGVGLTLTAACHIVFVQLPWSPAAFAQATDRIYRIGQERKCTVHILNMDGGISEKLWNVLLMKAEIVDAINNGKPTTIDTGSVYNAVLEEFGYAA